MRKEGGQVRRGGGASEEEGGQVRRGGGASEERRGGK